MKFNSTIVAISLIICAVLYQFIDLNKLSETSKKIENTTNQINSTTENPKHDVVYQRKEKMNTDENVNSIQKTGVDYLNKNNSTSEIANIWSRKGNSVTQSLFKNNFYLSPDYSELKSGNSDLISRLDLIKYADYVAMGEIKYRQSNGTFVEGTIISSASLKISIISSINGQIIRVVNISKNGNGVTEDQAKEDAIQKILQTLESDNSPINLK